MVFQSFVIHGSPIRAVQSQKNIWKHRKMNYTKTTQPNQGLEMNEARVRIINLPMSVGVDDIKNIFRQYDVRNINIDLNGSGESSFDVTTTGSMTVPRSQATKLIEQFSGMDIDGHRITLRLVNNKPVCRQLFSSHPMQASRTGRVNLRDLLEEKRKLKDRMKKQKEKNDALVPTFGSLTI